MSLPAPPADLSTPRERARADGLLVVMTAIWGVTFVMVKDALSQGDPFSFLTLRFCVGALALSALARRRMLTRVMWVRGASLGVFLFLGFALQTWGLVSVPPSRSAFITGLYVALVPVLGWVIFRRAPHASAWLGVVMALLGLYTLTGSDLDLGLGLTPGDALTLGGAVAYALHILCTERLAPRGDVVPLVAVQLWMVALLSALCLLVTGARVAWTPSFLGAAVFCGLVPSALALCMQAWAQARTSAVRVALVCCLEPVFAGLYSVALGLERLERRDWVGGGLIVLGVALAEVSGPLWTRLRSLRRAAPVPRPE